MNETPSSILTRAADLIRDTAAAATQNVCPSWTRQAVRHVARNCAIDCGHVHGDGWDHDGWDRYNDAAWIALMSPAVAPMIEKWLRDTAAYFDEFADYWVTIPEQARDALAMARAVLGEKEEQ